MKVYLIDDSSFINLVCRQALTKAGHEVIGESYDGEDGIKQVCEKKPDVVIMDVALPKKNGLEATEAILEEHPGIKIIAISALDDSWVEEKAHEAGCVSFLRKPFNAMDLVTHVENAFGHQKEVKYG